jgi:transcription elongation GreA/GreB family factor
VDPGPDKAAVIDALRRAVSADLDTLARMVGDARDEATGSESRAENQYDTRATEASYLAAGQGRRVVALRGLVDWLGQLDARSAFDAVASGALVCLRRGREIEWVLVGPEGGRAVTVDGIEVKLISARSPAGAALDGLERGDVEEVDTPLGPVEIEILAVR